MKDLIRTIIESKSYHKNNKNVMKDIIAKINENQLTFPHWKNKYWSEDLIKYLDSLNRENDEMAEIIGWFIVKALGETPKSSYKELRKQIDTALV